MSSVPSIAPATPASIRSVDATDTPEVNQTFGEVLAQQVDGKDAKSDPSPRSASVGSAPASTPQNNSGQQSMLPARLASDNPSAKMKTAAELHGVATSGKPEATATTAMVDGAGAPIISNSESLPAESLADSTSAKPADAKSVAKKTGAATPTSSDAITNMSFVPSLAPIGETMAPAPAADRSPPSPTTSSDRSSMAMLAGRLAPAAGGGQRHFSLTSGGGQLDPAGPQQPATDSHSSHALSFSFALQQVGDSIGVTQVKMKEPGTSSGVPPLAILLPPTSSGSVPMATAAAPTVQLQLSPAVQEQPAWGNALGQSVQWMAQGGVQQALIHLHPQHLGPMVVQLGVNDSGQASAVFLSDHPEVRAAISAALPQLQQSFAAIGLNLAQSNVGSGSSGMASNRRESADRDADTPGGVEEISSLEPATSGQMHRGLLSTFV